MEIPISISNGEIRLNSYNISDELVTRLCSELRKLGLDVTKAEVFCG